MHSNFICLTHKMRYVYSHLYIHNSEIAIDGHIKLYVLLKHNLIYNKILFLHFKYKISDEEWNHVY